jgi:oxygen-independent coproporphyrinogen-3 oxidase
VGAPRQGGEAQKIFPLLKNLYVHFPFCRRKCSYCALYSRAGASPAELEAYVARLARAVQEIKGGFKTVYFGGGTPALCRLEPLLAEIRPKLAPGAEFTVELHPLDATPELMNTLAAGGVNRISMGVQSLDDGILADMGRGYGFFEAERAFMLVKEHFDNAGIDLIVGYPGETSALAPRHARLAKWGLRHCSAYSLILEAKTRLSRRYDSSGAGDRSGRPQLLDDDALMNRVGVVASFLAELGLERYEVSNYAVPGFECRHNAAVWRGEDYIGLGKGAHGRQGLTRSVDFMGADDGGSASAVSPREDAAERAVFSLRTREGLDIDAWKGLENREEVRAVLDGFVEEKLLVRNGSSYSPTARGYEVCDSILAQII